MSSATVLAGRGSFQERLDLWATGYRRHSRWPSGKRAVTRVARPLHHEWWNGSGYPDSTRFRGQPIGGHESLERLSSTARSLLIVPYRVALTEGGQRTRNLRSSAGESATRTW